MEFGDDLEFANGSEFANRSEFVDVSPLNLAYLGDAVFELFVREFVFGKEQVNKLHKKSKNFVNAGAQAEMYMKILPLLSEAETNVMKRGRNAKSFTKAKNASLSDYRHATGFEALVGFLYVTKQTERLKEILEICVSKGNGNQANEGANKNE